MDDPVEEMIMEIQTGDLIECRSSGGCGLVTAEQGRYIKIRWLKLPKNKRGRVPDGDSSSWDCRNWFQKVNTSEVQSVE